MNDYLRLLELSQSERKAVNMVLAVIIVVFGVGVAVGMIL